MMFVTVTLSAQVGVNVGPKIGYQASKLSFKKSDMKSSLNNDLNLGIFTRFTFNRFIVQPEVLFSCQNRSIKLNNLSVPVMFGFKLLDDKNFKMRANVGPVAYFTVGNKSRNCARGGCSDSRRVQPGPITNESSRPLPSPPNALMPSLEPERADPTAWTAEARAEGTAGDWPVPQKSLASLPFSPAAPAHRH